MSKWRKDLEQQKEQEKTESKEEDPTKKEVVTLESFVGEASPAPEPQPTPEPAPTDDTILDWDVPRVGWIGSDKMRVISFLVFGQISRERIAEISEQLAKVFLLTAPKDQAKQVAQGFLDYLQKKEDLVNASTP